MPHSDASYSDDGGAGDAEGSVAATPAAAAPVKESTAPAAPPSPLPPQPSQDVAKELPFDTTGNPLLHRLEYLRAVQEVARHDVDTCIGQFGLNAVLSRHTLPADGKSRGRGHGARSGAPAHYLQPTASRQHAMYHAHTHPPHRGGHYTSGSGVVGRRGGAPGSATAPTTATAAPKDPLTLLLKEQRQANALLRRILSEQKEKEKEKAARGGAGNDDDDNGGHATAATTPTGPAASAITGMDALLALAGGAPAAPRAAAGADADIRGQLVAKIELLRKIAELERRKEAARAQQQQQPQGHAHERGGSPPARRERDRDRDRDGRHHHHHHRPQRTPAYESMRRAQTSPRLVQSAGASPVLSHAGRPVGYRGERLPTAVENALLDAVRSEQSRQQSQPQQQQQPLLHTDTSTSTTPKRGGGGPAAAGTSPMVKQLLSHFDQTFTAHASPSPTRAHAGTSPLAHASPAAPVQTRAAATSPAFAAGPPTAGAGDLAHASIATSPLQQALQAEAFTQHTPLALTLNAHEAQLCMPTDMPHRVGVGAPDDETASTSAMSSSCFSSVAEYNAEVDRVLMRVRQMDDEAGKLWSDTSRKIRSILEAPARTAAVTPPGMVAAAAAEAAAVRRTAPAQQAQAQAPPQPRAPPAPHAQRAQQPVIFMAPPQLTTEGARDVLEAAAPPLADATAAPDGGAAAAQNTSVCDHSTIFPDIPIPNVDLESYRPAGPTAEAAVTELVIPQATLPAATVANVRAGAADYRMWQAANKITPAIHGFIGRVSEGLLEQVLRESARELSGVLDLMCDSVIETEFK